MITQSYPELADALLRALAARQRSQQWLADQVFVSQGAVSNWINGQRRPAPDRLGHLAAVLELDATRLAAFAQYDDDPNAHGKVLAAATSWRAHIAIAQLA